MSRATKLDEIKLVLLRRQQKGINQKLRKASKSRLEKAVRAK